MLAGPRRDWSNLACASRAVLGAIVRQARGLLGGDSGALTFDATDGSAWSLGGSRESARPSLEGVRLFCNPAFLLVDSPSPAELLDAARAHGVAWCGSPASGDVHALAFGSDDVARRLRWPALRALTAGIDGEATSWRGLDPGRLLLPRVCPERSPAVRGSALCDVRPGPEAPRYLNTAVAELLRLPGDASDEGAVPAVAASLLAWRGTSRVPWIANSLLNELECQVGEPRPESFPLDLHVSPAGVCNLECRFCAYSHDTARYDRPSPEEFERLDFLQNMRVLRLSSGLGEPTANASLAVIIERTSARHPHLQMSFFTNGVNLHHHHLIETMIGRVRWVSVSLNAASADTWRDVCRADFFERVLRNLRDLHRAKLTTGSPLPLVYATMVLQGANLEDLPRMPALCREHGIDRFTGFPYSALNTRLPGKYGPEQALEACRDRYEALYERTLREAERHEVSIELPLPATRKEVSFGLERRELHDFARIETNELPLVRFVNRIVLPRPPRTHCGFLWRQASAASTRKSHSPQETHYLMPCLGPVASVDLSREAAFRFEGREAFRALWRNPAFTLLRRGQTQEGLVPVCDVCRGTDTRDPRHFARVRALAVEFAQAHTTAADGRRS